MGTTVEELRGWFEAGKKEGAAHMLVCWDSFDTDGGDYPVYLKPGVDAYKEMLRRQKEHGERVMECYTYSKTFDEQSTGRVFNFD